MIKPLVLIVEDDGRLRKFYARTLEAEQMDVRGSESAEEAWGLLQSVRPDIVVSDVVLKGKNGLEFCRELRSRPETANIPIVLISGTCVEDDDQISGLDSGADDYLLKPVSSKILVAKIQSVLRRYRSPHELADTLEIHGLKLDVKARTATLRNHPVALTRKEFDLLLAFLRQPGKMLTNDYLLEWVWGVAPNMELDTRTLTVHVSSLRNKLGSLLGGKIINIPRLGYRFEN